MFDGLSCSRAVFLKPFCAYRLSRDLVRMHVLIHRSGARLETLHF